MDGFVYVLAYKSLKMPFFAQKYLTRYTHETFFEEYTNFEAHYLKVHLHEIFHFKLVWPKEPIRAPE